MSNIVDQQIFNNDIIISGLKSEIEKRKNELKEYINNMSSEDKSNYEDLYYNNHGHYYNKYGIKCAGNSILPTLYLNEETCLKYENENLVKFISDEIKKNNNKLRTEEMEESLKILETIRNGLRQLNI
jgi:hypothetical protein